MDRNSIMIQEHIKTNWRFYLGLVYFTLLILVALAVFRKQTPAPAPVAQVTTPAPAAPTVDLEPLKQRIDQLERDLAQQAQSKRSLDAAIEQHERANQRFERRLQAHTEAFKRICEYVMVITIDKKLVPRQCLPEYKWSREEGA
jgi:septal ring factor EnvC (AmiA/AmiB activator)